MHLLQLSGLMILFLKSLDGYRSRKLFAFHSTKLVERLYIIHPIALAFSALLCLMSLITGAFEYYDQSLLLLITCSCIAGFIKRFYYYFPNNLESELEGLSMLCILALAFENLAVAELFSTAFFVISISAGLAKIKSTSWKPNGIALISFLTVPWQLRNRLRHYISVNISKLYSKTSLFRFFIVSLQVITPWAQLLSGIFIVTSLFSSQSSNILAISLLFQALFALTLFISADLGWIPHFQLWLTILFFYCYEINNVLPAESNFSTEGAGVGLFYLTGYCIFTVYSEFINIRQKLPVFAKKILSTIAIPLEPFSMFTEIESKLLITNRIIPAEDKTPGDFYFLKQTTKLSRYLMYHLYDSNDFVIFNHRLTAPPPSNKQPDYVSQFYSIINSLSSGQIVMYIYTWDKKNYSFASKLHLTLTISQQSWGIQRISLRRNHDNSQ
ncbi:putative membrane protein [Synechococcus sp. BIOS-E4-1]|uniref:hypothetical protein n=1 Tax=Synechococcus sp. BIOS-E4-1 TaxID=1400864 RepID=UPI001645C999|nr:hypothetical protein [Synechococcus sp. BIOS-E4-1]QNI54858.1 putative membrane protein [Synechococcus sp. BIOS-E4-1]